ncbi:MAG TPA: CocE/NonD family hydrolase [Candidatus Binataceae bacterium]|nr:CocE/NonD family hydrolase [Candidatus Binataceae bacterium]
MGAKVIFERDLEIQLRDGCVLKADLFRPDTPEKLPVLLNRTPYDKKFPQISFNTLDPLRAAQRGYNVVFVDCRGRYASPGTFNCFTDEQADGYDTIEQVARQPWADGKVGMFGASYMGATQWLAATQAPPSLKAMVPAITASDYHDNWTYQGGAFSLFFNVSWLMTNLALARLMREREEKAEARKELAAVMGAIDTMREAVAATPLKDFPLFRTGAPYFFDWLEHPYDDAYWRKLCIEEYYPKINIPTLNFGGWYDIFAGGTVRNYAGMRAKGASAGRNARLVMGPWFHTLPLVSQVGQADMGFRAGYVSIDFDGQQLSFFDHWLKGKNNGEPDESPVRVYTIGANQWRDEKDWPIPDTEWRRYYLHSRGKANSAAGDGALSTATPDHEPPDCFLYNPLNPVPTNGGGLCCYHNAVPGGAFDQTAIETREDVLVYTTEPLAEATEITGPISLTLYASSSAPDTDFTAKLVAVGACGCTAMNLTDGILRARVRESKADPKLITPGKIYEFTIDMWSTSILFKAGDRIRLEVSSSNFPRFDRNPNTGHELFIDAETRPALQTIMHDRGFASYLTLPVIPPRR